MTLWLWNVCMFLFFVYCLVADYVYDDGWMILRLFVRLTVCRKRVFTLFVWSINAVYIFCLICCFRSVGSFCILTCALNGHVSGGGLWCRTTFVREPQNQKQKLIRHLICLKKRDNYDVSQLLWNAMISHQRWKISRVGNALRYIR